MNQPEAFAPPQRHYVPDGLDPGEWSTQEAIFEELESRQLASVGDLERWIHDVSELESVLGAEEARRYIRMTCHTDDPEHERRFLEFSREIEPRARVALDRLDRVYLASSYRHELPRPRFDRFDRVKASDAEIFSRENLPLQTEETALTTQYTQIMASMTVEVDGEEMALARAAVELEQPDRSRREEIWRKIANRRFRDRDAIEENFGNLLSLRNQMATHVDRENYRDLRFQRMRRFDYGIGECEAFHDAVRSVVVPAVHQLNEERRARLGQPSLRPWDFEVRLYGSAPIRPFETEETLCDLARRLFACVHPRFAVEFEALERQELLDLLARPNKAPGGYQYFLEDVRMPFIFANAVGTHDDIQTLLHEGGHAFHSLACRDEPILLYRDPPLEFCEVASMGMEAMALEHVGEIYPDDVAHRVRCAHLEKIPRLLAWIATVDAYQHWLYTAADSGDPARRRAQWVRLRTLFGPEVDWSELESFREVEWHRQGHIFRQPFYYIEYGIAQIGALQLWSRFRRDPAATVERYREALALGGSRSLRQLFEAAGLRFEFGPELLSEIIGELLDEWNRLRRALG